MDMDYKIIYEGGEAEIVEKKSRFIATVTAVDTEEEALEFIEKLRKKYWNATHNCFAYVVGEHHELQRCSDDGEPSGTAGRPMLDVILGENLHNMVVVVTRYFGGTLLGTGGLVRAYSSSVKAGLEASKVITRLKGIRLLIETDYTGLGKIQYVLGERQISILDSVYTDKVELEALVPEEMMKEIEEELTEKTNGRAKLEKGDTCYYAKMDGQVEIL